MQLNFPEPTASDTEQSELNKHTSRSARSLIDLVEIYFG